MKYDCSVFTILSVDNPVKSKLAQFSRQIAPDRTGCTFSIDIPICNIL